MSDDPGALPSAWAAYLPLATSLVRTLLAAGGGLGFAWAKAVTGDQVTMAVTAAMMVAAAIWGLYQKIQALRALRTASVQPAGVAPPKLPA